MTTKEKVERLQFLVDDKIELIRWIMLGTPIFEVIPGIKCLAEFTETPVKNVYNIPHNVTELISVYIIYIYEFLFGLVADYCINPI